MEHEKVGGETVSEPPCHCGESGYYHCSELRSKLEEVRKLIQLMLDTGCLQQWAYEVQPGDDASIYMLCLDALKMPDGVEYSVDEQ